MYWSTHSILNIDRNKYGTSTINYISSLQISSLDGGSYNDRAGIFGLQILRETQRSDQKFGITFNVHTRTRKADTRPGAGIVRAFT